MRDYEVREIVDILREIRISSSITQAAVGAATGMSQAQISVFENGPHNPQLDTVLRYAKAVGAYVEISSLQDDWDTDDEWKDEL